MDEAIIIVDKTKCGECGKEADPRYKDPRSKLWLCYMCDRAFKSNVYGKEVFQRGAGYV